MKWRRWTEQETAKLKQYLRQHLTDNEIAARLGRTRWSVQGRRKSLGLRQCGSLSKKIKRVSKRKLREDGYNSLVERRDGPKRCAVLLAGWPAGATPRDAKGLSALHAKPWLTLAELAAASGQKHVPKGHCSARTAVRRLVQPGWVVWRWRSDGGRGKNVKVYDLAPSVRAARDLVINREVA